MIKAIELTDTQKEELDKRILKSMLDVYSEVKCQTDMPLKDEVKIILQAIEAGNKEERKINIEFREKNPDSYFLDDFDTIQMIMSCVVGKIIFKDDNDFCAENLHPYNIYGYRLRALVKAIQLIASMSVISDIEEDDGYIPSYLTGQALDLLKED